MEEGLFAIHVPKKKGEWHAEKILEEPISEFSLYDLDADGKDEIVAIQPFHGDRVCIYKHINGEWSRVFETDTELGHGIWAGSIGGENGFIIGSRAGNRDLCLFTCKESMNWDLKKYILDEGVGSAQFNVIHEKDYDLVVSTNNYINEIALYQVTT